MIKTTVPAGSQVSENFNLGTGEWVIEASCSSWGSNVLKLRRYSEIGTWYDVTDVSGPIEFSSTKAYIVYGGGLYSFYEKNSTNMGSAATIKIERAP